MGRASGRHGNRAPRQPGTQPGTPEGDYTGESERQMPGPRPDSSPIPSGDGPHISNQPSHRQHVPVPGTKPEFAGMMAHGVPPGPATTHEHAEHEAGPNAVKAVRPQYQPLFPKPSPVPVYLVKRATGARELRTQAGDRYTVPATGTASIRIAGRDHDRTNLGLLVESASGGTLVSTPAVPASTVAKQNPYNFPVQVVITAGTITAVVVNGVTVGTAAGTYYVPAFGSISTTNSVAPTWAWTDATGAGGTGIRVDHEVGNLDVGFGNLVKPSASNYLVIPSQDELFAVGADTYTYVLSVLYLYDIAAAGG